MLELINLSKEYGKLTAVNKISLTIEKGEVRGLIGPNGSGKTTLFNTITGFVKPSGGQVIWQGENITGLAPHAISQKGIIRTFQLTNIYSDLTALQNVIMSSHLQTKMGYFEQYLRFGKAKRKEKAVKEKALSYLELMNLAKLKDEIAGKLPGGTQKILSISNAMAAKPQLLMLDEPLAGLNDSEKSIMMEKIKTIRDMGIIILIVEHDMKSIMNTCDQVTVINFGKKIAEGSPKEVSRDAQTIKAYLGKEEYRKNIEPLGTTTSQL